MEQQESKKKKDPIWRHAKFRAREYRRADELWEDAMLYFEWCDENPVDAPISVIRYKKEKHGGSKEMKKQDQQENVTRPYTLYGLCAFLGIARWYKFKAQYIEKEGFEDVLLTIENVIASQQIDGAMTGVFKENLTARLNGLADKTQQELNGEIEVNTEHKFTGFSFLPYTAGLGNSEQSRIASGEVIEELPVAETVVVEEPEKVIDYAEIVSEDEVPIGKRKAERGL